MSACTDPHVDGCGECILNVEEPYLINRAPDGCTAAYRCADCGHHWTTCWGY